MIDFGKFHFGTIKIDGVTYERDVVIDRGEVRKRKKRPSKKFRDKFGHTPVSIEEEAPWKCQRLVIGAGKYESLPVMDEVKREAHRRKITLLTCRTRAGHCITGAKDRRHERHSARHVLKVAAGSYSQSKKPVCFARRIPGLSWLLLSEGKG